jgi:hypothetical protein
VKILLRGSLGLVPTLIEGEVDTSELDPELARRAEALLSPEHLRGARVAENPQQTDAEEFELTIWPDERSGPGERFRISRRDTAPEVVAVAGELLNAIVRRRAQELGRGTPRRRG